MPVKEFVSDMPNPCICAHRCGRADDGFNSREADRGGIISWATHKFDLLESNHAYRILGHDAFSCHGLRFYSGYDHQAADQCH